MADTTKVDFYFDVLCPFAWRTSLWIRQARRERPIDITWKQMSLVMINDPELKQEWAAKGFALGRTFIQVERTADNEGVDRLYIALGDVIHGGGGANPLEPAVMVAALEKAGLPADLHERAMGDPSTEEAYKEAHAEAVNRGAFGVPTLFLEGSDIGFFGPVLDPVPTGQAAAELWDYTNWALKQPYLYEFKRERKNRLGAQPALD